MKLTKEQLQIINSTGNIKINAVAGSGKTTTIIEYAKSRPPKSKILYLAFNKSVKLEAVKKFHERKMYNVKVETAHSIAYRNIVFKHNYKVRNQSYTSFELVQLLNLQAGNEKLAEFVIANHINKFVAYFCNSNKAKVSDLNYLDLIIDKKAKVFVKSFYSYIEKQTRILLAKMNSGEIEITHDFYLKKFQLSNPKLYFDYILFDEAQDASPAMLDVFLKQENTTKVIVGDTHQQIYSWRHAINSLEKANFKEFYLTTSFRFNSNIAKLGVKVLEWKKLLDPNYKTVTIKGKGTNKKVKSKVVIARTNLGLLLRAIEYTTNHSKSKKIYFEGNINSYTYADEGTSLYDVLNLYSGKRKYIRNKLVLQMKDIDELTDYIEKTEDVQLGLMLEIVLEYGEEIPIILKKLKSMHIDSNEKDKADIIFSTVHKCKGMEYDSIELVKDFITYERLESIIDDTDEDELNFSKLNEEINLLYVAITRTKNKLIINEELLPINFPEYENIIVISEDEEKQKVDKNLAKLLQDIKKRSKEKSFSYEKVREKHKKAYKPWTEELDFELTTMFCEDVKISEIANKMDRTYGSIKSRIKKLNLEELYK